MSVSAASADAAQRALVWATLPVTAIACAAWLASGPPQRLLAPVHAPGAWLQAEAERGQETLRDVVSEAADLRPHASARRDMLLTRLRDAIGPPGAGPAAPSAAERANFAAMSPEERAVMMRAVAAGLASRLEESPDDVEGWLRLGQAYVALGDEAAAIGAFDRALDLKPDSPSVLKAYAASFLGGADATGAPAVSERAAGVYRRSAELAPRDPEPHWYLGLNALQSGHPGAAVRHWRRLLALLGPAHPDHAMVEARLRTLEAGIASSPLRARSGRWVRPFLPPAPPGG